MPYKFDDICIDDYQFDSTQQDIKKLFSILYAELEDLRLRVAALEQTGDPYAQ